ncbi:MAG: hypothetical protein ABSG68_14885 [Thermoguttaceae bacterium]|jgi:hypothetical protein
MGIRIAAALLCLLLFAANALAADVAVPGLASDQRAPAADSKLRWLPFNEDDNHPGDDDSGADVRQAGTTAPAADTEASESPSNIIADNPPAAAPPEPPAAQWRPVQPALQPIPAPQRGGRDTGRLPRLENMPQRAVVAEKCPTPQDLKPISQIDIDIEAERGDFPKECPLGEAAFRGRAWRPVTYTWTASGACNKPAYFEDVQLERYGHSCGPVLQMFASGIKFYLTFPILPYKMGVDPPGECQYDLGYYRPGSCAPYTIDPFPLSVRGAMMEGMAWTGAVVALQP